MKTIDFSSKHDILLENEDGSLQPMDVPFFQAIEFAPRTWQVLSDGDYSYLLAGEDEAFVIDSGYGAGNIREFCQTLTEKPVRNIANTHDHFDHTACNGYFENAYMSIETEPLATIPFPSFAGIEFPRDYPKTIVDDGDVIPLKGRNLTVIKIPDHAVGSLVFLDRTARILFCGDELGMPVKPLNGSVERWARYMEKILVYRDQFDLLAGGGGLFAAQLVERNLSIARQILAGAEGEVGKAQQFPNFERIDSEGRRIWKRRLPHPGDGPKDWDQDLEFKRVYRLDDCALKYDIRRVFEK